MEEIKKKVDKFRKENVDGFSSLVSEEEESLEEKVNQYEQELLKQYKVKKPQNKSQDKQNNNEEQKVKVKAPVN